MRWKTTLILLIITVGIGAYVSLYELRHPTVQEQERLAKQVLRVSEEQITRLVVECPDGKVALNRLAGAWRLERPVRARADDTLLRRILKEVSFVESSRVLEPSEKNPLALADYGLAPAQGLVAVTEQGGRTTTVLFGDRTAVEARRYVKRADAPEIFVVSARLFETLNQPLEAYRSRELLVFEPWNVQQLVVWSPSLSYTLTKQRDSATPIAASKNQWQITAPFMDDADNEFVEDTLSKLRNWRVQRVLTDVPQVEQLSDWGFDSAYAHITLLFKDETPPLELWIGHPLSDDSHALSAKRVDEPTIYAVAEDLNRLPRNPQAFRSRAVLPFAPEAVTKLQIDWQDRSWTMEQRREQWKLAGAPPLALDGSKVQDFLWPLHTATVSNFVNDMPTPKDLELAGLQPPAGRIQVWVTGRKEPRELLVGGLVAPGPGRYGYLPARHAIVELPEAINQALSIVPESLKAESSADKPTP